MSYKVSFTIGGDYPVCQVIHAGSFAEAIWQIKTSWVRPRIWTITRCGR